MSYNVTIRTEFKIKSDKDTLALAMAQLQNLNASILAINSVYNNDNCDCPYIKRYIVLGTGIDDPVINTAFEKILNNLDIYFTTRKVLYVAKVNQITFTVADFNAIYTALSENHIHIRTIYGSTYSYIYSTSCVNKALNIIASL